MLSCSYESYGLCRKVLSSLLRSAINVFALTPLVQGDSRYQGGC